VVAECESDIHVEFRRSGKTVPWIPTAESLLTLALDNDVYISSGCCYGDCGTCMTPLLSGTIAYEHPTGADPDSGSCLPCSCKPITSIVLDA
jgi:ferredoxin